MRDPRLAQLQIPWHGRPSPRSGDQGSLENACVLQPSPGTRVPDVARMSRAFCPQKPPDKRLRAFRASREVRLFGRLSALAPLASPIAACIGRAGPELRSGAPGATATVVEARTDCPFRSGGGGTGGRGLVGKDERGMEEGGAEVT